VGLAYAAICPHRAENQTPAQTKTGLVQRTRGFILNDTELRDKILDFLLENGETKSRDVHVVGSSNKTVGNNLIRMFDAGVLSRRKVDKKFVYSIRDREDFYLNNEPGYAYYLRNLPREMSHEQR
jgi:hypothetical protein